MMSGFLRLFSVLISEKFHVHLSVAFYHNVHFATYFLSKSSKRSQTYNHIACIVVRLFTPYFFVFFYLTEVEMVCMPADFTQFRRRQIDNRNVYDRLAPLCEMRVQVSWEAMFLFPIDFTYFTKKSRRM